MDTFAEHSPSLVSSARKHEVADHSAGDHEFAVLPRQVLIIGAGAFRARLVDDDADLDLDLPAGTILLAPWRVSIVRQTTAAGVAVIGFA